MSETRHIFYLAVARFSDHVIVASYSVSDKVGDQPIKSFLQGPDVFLIPRQRYSTEGDSYTIHFLPDDRKRVYIAVTDPDYPTRVAFALIEEMQSKFLDKVGVKSLTGGDGALSGTSKKIFSDLCSKYEDLKNVDKLASIQDKVNVTKTIMGDAIQQMLQNNEKVDGIGQKADLLGNQAKIFKAQGKQLRRKMWWKGCKMKLLIAFIVIVILTIIIVPTAVTISKRRHPRRALSPLQQHQNAADKTDISKRKKIRI